MLIFYTDNEDPFITNFSDSIGVTIEKRTKYIQITLQRISSDDQNLTFLNLWVGEEYSCYIDILLYCRMKILEIKEHNLLPML